MPALTRLLLFGLFAALSACGQFGGSTDIAAETVPVDMAYRISPEAEARFSHGLRAMDAQNWPVALTAMDALWNEYPWLSGPPLNAALVHQHQGHSEEAETWFRRALQSNAGNIDARNAYAVFLRELGRFDEAEQQYLSALEIAGDDATTHFNLGILYDLYLGQKAQALEHYIRYQQIGDADRQVQGWVADLQRQLAAREDA